MTKMSGCPTARSRSRRFARGIVGCAGGKVGHGPAEGENEQGGRHPAPIAGCGDRGHFRTRLRRHDGGAHRGGGGRFEGRGLLPLLQQGRYRHLHPRGGHWRDRRRLCGYRRQGPFGRGSPYGHDGFFRRDYFPQRRIRAHPRVGVVAARARMVRAAARFRGAPAGGAAQAD